MTDPQGNTITLNKVPFSQTGKYLDAHYKNLGITAAPSASQHVGGGDANTAVPNLPMAQTDTPANNMSTTSGGRSTPATSLQPIPNNAQGTAIRNQIAQKIQGGGADKTALADVTAKGTMDVRHDPNSGAIYVIGQSGKPYRVQ
jgi:hypothetical protein